MAFQNDEKTYEQGVDFMWGDHLMVANVVEKGATTRSVYLPITENVQERFYDFYTGQEYMSGQEIELPVDIGSIPLFVRSGAIIPMAENQLYNLMRDEVTGLHILFAPDMDSSFCMYDDDGKTNNYKDGEYLKTDISVRAGVKTYIRFTSEGNYESPVETMYLDVIHREKSPFYVEVEGRQIPHFLHRRQFEETEEGWYYSQTKKSVQVKYKNPKHDHEVMISFEVFDMLGM